ncbi:MAG: pentapeptide repeat-containing protein [Magnetovibrionaceae bacterium]
MDGSGEDQAQQSKRTASGGPKGPSRGLNWSKQHLIIVEPVRGLRRCYADIFKGVGAADVRTADSFADAVAVLKEFPACTGALIELALPGDTNGVQLIRSIRNGIHGRNTGFPIMISVEAVNTHLLFEACRAGIEGALRKPVDPDTLAKRFGLMMREPKRFIGERHYFGPDRRKADLPFEGAERRKDAKPKVEVYNPGKLQGGELGVMEAEGPARPAFDGPLVDEPKAGQKSSPVALVDEEEPQKKPASAPLVEEAKPKKAEAPEQPPTPKAKKKPEPEPEPKAVEVAEQQEEAPAEEPEELTTEQVLDQHKLWVNTGGREGERMVLANADLRGLDLTDSDLTGANLEGANLSGQDCNATIFRKSILTDAKMQQASAIKGDFAVARLKNTNLQGARLDGACFRGADLTGAKLSGASLARTDFTSARLYGTDLRGCDLRYAVGLNQAQLNRTNSDGSTRLPNGLQPRVQAKS